MEPRQPILERAAGEQSPQPLEVNFRSSQETAEAAPRSPEMGHEQEQAARVEVAQMHPMPSALPPPASLPGGSVASTLSTAVPVDDIPLVANDDDLIEKEWVEKAKSIITSTKDDPYTREREITKLQIEYIRKRYGREIGDSGG